jgi:predicted anti-sigma-YlaC factor YlaD
MTCADLRDRLDAQRDGAPFAALPAELAAHLDQCAECRADWEASRSQSPLVAGLPRELAPGRDLWSGISARLRPRRRPGRITLPVWALVAASLLLVAGSAVVTRGLLRWGESVPGGEGDLLPVRFAEAEAGYRAEVVELTRVYDQARERLAPATREVIERNLAVIEAALRESRLALERDPTNASLETLVHAAYRRKIEFLERASVIDRES